MRKFINVKMCGWNKFRLHIFILIAFCVFASVDADAQTQITSSGTDSILLREQLGYAVTGNLFVKNKDSLLPSTLIYLDSVADFLAKHPKVNLEIICSPDNKYEYQHHKLGQQREVMIYDYLIHKKNVQKDQVVIFGYSESIIRKNAIKNYSMSDKIQFVVIKAE